MKMTKGAPLVAAPDRKTILRKDSHTAHSSSTSTSAVKSTSSQGKIHATSSSPTISAGNAGSPSNSDLGADGANEFATIYEGQWAEDREHGRGTKYWADGKVYHGSWLDGTQTGEGVCKYANGAFYFGTWDNNFVCAV